jgi:FixJ family two-component response regulator
VSNSGVIVYIVDDDRSVRSSLSRLLRCAGFNCRTYASAEDLIAELLPDTRGCVIADVHMPGMSGLELVRVLRDTRPLVSTVLMTAFDSPDARMQACAAGIDILTKPFDDSVLLAAVSRALVGAANR